MHSLFLQQFLPLVHHHAARLDTVGTQTIQKIIVAIGVRSHRNLSYCQIALGLYS